MSRVCHIICFLILVVSVAEAQTNELFLSESEIQSIVNNSDKVDAKIEELTAQMFNRTELRDEISLLQTILILEPYSQDAHCSLGIAYGRISELVMRVGASEDARKLIHTGLWHEQLCSDYNSKRVCSMLGKLGSFHLIAGNLDSSLHYFRIAEAYTDTMRDPVWHSSALNNLGMACKAAGKRDSAYMHYNASIFELNNNSEEHQSLLGSITDNLAQWHEDNGELHLAEQRHEENIERFKLLKDTLHLAQAFIGAARTKWELNKGSVSFQYMDSAYQLMSSYTQEAPRRAGMIVDQFHLKSKLYREMGKFEDALQAADSALAWEKRHNELNGEALMAMFSVLKESEVARVRRERSLRKDLLESEDKAHSRLIMLIVSIIVIVAAGISIAIRKR